MSVPETITIPASGCMAPKRLDRPTGKRCAGAVEPEVCEKWGSACRKHNTHPDVRARVTADAKRKAEGPKMPDKKAAAYVEAVKTLDSLPSAKLQALRAYVDAGDVEVAARRVEGVGSEDLMNWLDEPGTDQVLAVLHSTRPESLVSRLELCVSAGVDRLAELIEHTDDPKTLIDGLKVAMKDLTKWQDTRMAAELDELRAMLEQLSAERQDPH